MRVYLAGPIADTTDEEANGWRSLAKQLLADHETVDPMARDFRGVDVNDEVVRMIVEGDKADIDGCDVVLAYCPKPTVGTSMEILYAFERQKKVLIVCPVGATCSPWLRYHANAMFTSVKDAVERLLLVNAQRCSINGCANGATKRVHVGAAIELGGSMIPWDDWIYICPEHDFLSSPQGAISIGATS